jgi:ParB-like chromosome segregation protein Spo0J
VTLAAVFAPHEAPVAPSEVGTIAINAVQVGPSMRAAGIDPLHVAALAEVAAHWPPIVVNRADSSVVDGHHRIAAARQLGLRELCVTWFDGSAEDAYLEFVRCNVGHGLPLTLAERRQAARQMLRSHAQRSDRAIASVCGVSPTTIARLRKDGPVEWAGDGTRDAKGRVGLDGRVRPLNGMALRAHIAQELALRPEASLRAIAGTVGASPETVRSVRNELRASTGAAKYATMIGRDAVSVLDVSPIGTRVPSPSEDRAFTHRDGGQEFVDWFEATSVENLDPRSHLEVVPLSRVYEIADVARSRAEFWSRFANLLETRVRRWA